MTNLEQFYEMNKTLKSLAGSSSFQKVLEQFKNQEKQYHRLLNSNSFAMPRLDHSLALQKSMLDAIGKQHLIGKQYSDLFNHSFRKMLEVSLPTSRVISEFMNESATTKLFRQLSKSPLPDFNKLVYPQNLMDLMATKHIYDFEQRYKDSLRLSTRHISSAIAISKVLGSEGVHAHYEELLKELKKQDDESPSDDKKWTFTKEFILSILITFLVTLYQKIDSEQMEQRLNDKIDAKTQEVVFNSSKQHNELKEQITNLESLIVKFSQAHQTQFKSAEYIVKDRVASVRDVPTSGSKVIAHIFPNQVVTIIDSEGKWIEVTYYDWAKRNYMNGWVLKKYLERVKQK